VISVDHGVQFSFTIYPTSGDGYFRFVFMQTQSYFLTPFITSTYPKVSNDD
jgi:hypothetical protein